MEWISVKDRLPELVRDDSADYPDKPMSESDRVLTYNGTNYNIARLTKFGDGNPIFNIGLHTTHWMQLIPPKEE